MAFDGAKIWVAANGSSTMKDIVMILACTWSLSAQEHQRPGVSECPPLPPAIQSQAASQGFDEAEKALLSASSGKTDSRGHSCTGELLTNLAMLALTWERHAEATKIAERSVQLLEREYSPNDPVLLRPLCVVASSRFQLGEAAKAREAFHRMQSIPVADPAERLLIDHLAGTLLESEGHYREAESAYRTALFDLEEAGLGEMADAGAVWRALGALYIREQRLDEARGVLDRAVAISSSATDAVAFDRLKALHVRGVLYARQRKWAYAERDLHDALAIADGEPRLDPAVLKPILTDYARVLRKNHHSHDARLIETRIASIPPNRRVHEIVDVTELVQNPSLTKK